MTTQNKTWLCLTCALLEEDMMDSAQMAPPAQPTEELTELGKCLLKHEVSRRRTTLAQDGKVTAVYKLNVSLSFPRTST